MIKAAIFDFAGVVTTKDGYWTWLAETVKDLDAKRHVFEKFSQDVDCAAISHDDFICGVASAAGVSPEEVWPEIRSGLR